MFAHQAPEYFPSLSYVALMSSVDQFYADVGLQYSRQSFQNRARIRTPDGSQWITVPVCGRQYGLPIRETKIDYRDNWVRKHLNCIIKCKLFYTKSSHGKSASPIK